MVIAVLAGLTALAVPFVLSMLLQGRGARSDLHAAQARAAAEGALDHALAHLYRTSLKSPGYDPSPDMDTVDELKVNMGLGGANANLQDPQGLFWSARIEDEQGKVNLMSAPPALIGSLLGATTLEEPCQKGAAALIVLDPGAFRCDADPATPDGLIGIGSDLVRYSHVQGTQVFLAPQGEYWMEHSHRRGDLVYDGRAPFICDHKLVQGRPNFRPFRSIYEIKVIAEGFPLLSIQPDEFARIERFITVHSGREGPTWGHAERLLDQSLHETQRGFGVENGAGFGPGALVRFTQAGRVITHARVVRTMRRPDQKSYTVVIDQDVGVTVSGSGVGNEIYMEPLLRHPININTAPPEVIYACVMGVGLATDTDTVTHQQALILANLLASRNYLNSDDLSKALDEARQKGILTGPLRDAVYFNATEPNCWKVRLSTTTFCYRSYGGYTLEGSATVNAPNGVQLARSTLRQIVTLPTPPPGKFHLKTQEDWQKLVDEGMTQHVVTWPVAQPNRKKYPRMPVLRPPDKQTGQARLDVGEAGSHRGDRDNRRVQDLGQLGSQSRGWPKEFLDHCDEPRDPGFFQEGYDFDRREAFKLEAVASEHGNYQGYFPSTGVELWYRPRGAGAAYIFDSGEDEERNRVSFLYEPSQQGLVIRIWDSNLEKKYVEYIYPCKLDVGDWWHVAGSWRTSWPGGQEVRVDASPMPRDQPAVFKPSTFLASSLNENEVDSLSVEDADAAQLPAAGAVRIGEEIIEYYKRQGSKLAQLRRGTRLSTAAPHNEGEVVMNYGYVCKLTEDLPPAKGLLAESMEARRPTTRVVCKKPNHEHGKDHDCVLHDATEFAVEDASSFPPCGFLLVNGEPMYYGKRTATTFSNITRVNKLPRAIYGCTVLPRNLMDRNQVELIGFQVTDGSSYDVPRSGDSWDGLKYVQIDAEGSKDEQPVVEWLSYGDPYQMSGKWFLLPAVGLSGDDNTRIWQGPAPAKEFTKQRYMNDVGQRGSKGTDILAHDKGAKVIPVVHMDGPQIGERDSPVGRDISTVSVLQKGSREGEVRWIKRAYTRMFPRYHWDTQRDKSGKVIGRVFVWDDWAFEYMAGLDDFVSRRFPSGDSRFLRFPSGELPDVASPRTVGASRDGTGKLNGDVDEVKVLALGSLGAKIAWRPGDGPNFGLPKGADTLLLEDIRSYPRNGGSGNQSVLGWPTTGGLLRIDDEIISYESCGTETYDYYADVGYVSLKAHTFNRGDADDDDNFRDSKVEARETRDLPRILRIKQERIYQGTGGSYPNNNNERITVLKLFRLKRGLLGTDDADHPPGSGVMLYDAAPFTVLSAGLADNSDGFAVKDARGFPDEGFALVNDEAISWLKREGNGFTGCQHYHQRFGTPAGQHAAGDLVRCLPFRYYDRHAREYDGQGLAYLQAGHGATDAIWDSIELKIGSYARQPLPGACRPRILVRFDGQPNWDQRPTNREGGIWEFYNQGIHSFGSRSRPGVRADQIEIRVFWQYDNGAFQPNNDWKRCFGISELRAIYYNPLTIRRLDEVERR